ECRRQQKASRGSPGPADPSIPGVLVTLCMRVNGFRRLLSQWSPALPPFSVSEDREGLPPGSGPPRPSVRGELHRGDPRSEAERSAGRERERFHSPRLSEGSSLNSVERNAAAAALIHTVVVFRECLHR
ncbi:hypothetical protein NHX12_033170, partial [Muraenolepis orangiensis]